MDLTDMTREERREIMAKRYEFFSEMAAQCMTLEEFKEKFDLKLAIMGIELLERDDTQENYLALRVQLDYSDYEMYHLLQLPEHKLAISHIIWWQDPYCFNDTINLFTGESVDEKEIPKQY